MLSLVLQFVLLVVNAEGHSFVEPSDRLDFKSYNAALTVNGSESDDQGDYTFIVDGQVLRRTQLRHSGLSLKDVIMIAALTAGQLISAASLHSAMLPDQWRWKTLGGTLGNAYYISILCIYNSLLLTTMYVTILYWLMGEVAGLSPLHFSVVGAMIVGQVLSSFFITVLLDVTRNLKLREGSQSIRIWLKLKAVYDIVLKDCFIVFLIIIIITFFRLSTRGIVRISLSIVLPFVIILILMYWFLKKSLDKEGERNQRNERKVRGCSIKAILIAALWFVVLMLPFTNVIRVLYVICRNPNEELVFFETGAFNLIPLTAFSAVILIPVISIGFLRENTVTSATSITVEVLILVFFISLVILWYRGFHRLRRWISLYNVDFLIVIIIATISWMVIEGLRPEDLGVAIISMVGLVFSAAYVIIFMCWSWKDYPDDKQWWWRLNICNIVALVFNLIALICWTVEETSNMIKRGHDVHVMRDQIFQTSIPMWIIFTLSAATIVTTLSRSFPVCSKNKGTNENNHAVVEQDREELHELQTLSPGLEA